MNNEETTIPLPIRWFAILLGMVFLFWIPFEDSNTTAPLLFAMALTTLGAVIFLSSDKRPFRTTLLNFILAGTLVGIVISPLTLFLMAFKTGLHSHQAPEFSNQQMLSIIYRTPIWLIGGFLVGLGSGLWLVSRES
jgi:ABC-type Fe3+-siderophore transport system permease subunit